jgi:hypothetical protein
MKSTTTRLAGASAALTIAFLAALSLPARVEAQANAATPASPTPIVAAEPSSAAQLGWLAGCWELRRPNGVRIEESWTRPVGGLLLGTGRTSRTVAGGAPRVLEFELSTIEERADALVYVARPSGQARTEFVADTVTATVASFANPAHDFPTRVRYERRGADSLVARISGPGRDGAERAIAFPYSRVPCPAAAKPDADAR